MKTYFIYARILRAVKIGIAKDPVKRLTTLQIGSPVDLELLGTLNGNHETELHHKFGTSRIRGEWFSLLKGSELRRWLESEFAVSLSARRNEHGRYWTNRFMWETARGIAGLSRHRQAMAPPEAISPYPMVGQATAGRF